MQEYTPHNYQKIAIKHILDNPKAALFLDMGCGKTSITLSAIEYLTNSLEIQKTLIISPKRVTSQSWPAEIAKWRNFESLSYSKVIGTPDQRIAALKVKADIYLISRDNVQWLIHHLIKTTKRFGFDCIVVDESSSFKNVSSMRFKALKKVAPLARRVILLTGTPASNQLLNLYGQLYLLDQGQRLGRTYTEFKDRYFTPGARQGHVVFSYEIRPGAKEQIYVALSDICMSMKAADYLELPPKNDVYEEVTLTSYEKYKEFKKTEVLPMLDGGEITPVNQAAMYSLLLQYCQGAIYRTNDKGEKYYEVVDDSKLESLAESVEALDGNPVFIIYQFISDYERIAKKIPGAKKLVTDEDIEAFNRGEIAVGMSQISSLAFGINLQAACHTIFHFGLSWNLELYQQIVARIHRQGQKKPVLNKHFVAKDSIEQLVIERLNKKDITQSELMVALKRHLL